MNANCPDCYGRPRGLCPNCGQIGPEEIDPPPDRVNVWMRFRDRWVIHTKGATRYHASLHEDADHPVLPVGCPNDPCAFRDCTSHGHCCAITPHESEATP